MDCIQAGAHVIVEKPVATRHSEFECLLEFAQSHGKRIVEDHNYRFNRRILDIESLWHAGMLGEVCEVEVRMALPLCDPGGAFSDENLPNPCHQLPAGALHDFLPHLCYLALRFLPSVDRVAAAWRKHGTHPLFTYDDLDAVVIGGAVHARLRFTSQQRPDCFTVVVRGSRGWVETDLFQPYFRLSIPRRGGKQLTPLVNQFANGLGFIRDSLRGFAYKVKRVTPLEGLQTFLMQTYTALQTGNEPPVSVDDMDTASRLIDALLDPANRV
jgi:predicted dehydrogenase